MPIGIRIVRRKRMMSSGAPRLGMWPPDWSRQKQAHGIRAARAAAMEGGSDAITGKGDSQAGRLGLPAGEAERSASGQTGVRRGRKPSSPNPYFDYFSWWEKRHSAATATIERLRGELVERVPRRRARPHYTEVRHAAVRHTLQPDRQGARRPQGRAGALPGGRQSDRGHRRQGAQLPCHVAPTTT